MPSKYDYEQLLKRAKKRLPEDTTIHERFILPEIDILIEGKSTVWRNFGDFVSVLNRDENHLLQYLLRELGTAGVIQGKRLIFKRRLTEEEIDERVKSYLETYVMCTECHRPDTRLVKEGRVLMLECDACGAKRAVTVRKHTKPVAEAAIKEGGIYNLVIQDVGQKGDGMARVDKYVIYVPGTAKGTQVKVKIEKISGNVAFGTVVRE